MEELSQVLTILVGRLHDSSLFFFVRAHVITTTRPNNVYK